MLLTGTGAGRVQVLRFGPGRGPRIGRTMRCAPARPACAAAHPERLGNAELNCWLTMTRCSFAPRSSCICIRGLLQPLLHPVSKNPVLAKQRGLSGCGVRAGVLLAHGLARSSQRCITAPPRPDY